MCARIESRAGNAASLPSSPGEREQLRAAARELCEALRSEVHMCALSDDGALVHVFREPDDDGCMPETSRSLSAEAIDAIYSCRAIELESQIAEVFSFAHGVLVPMTHGGGRWVAVVSTDEPLTSESLNLLTALGRRAGAALAAERGSCEVDGLEALVARLKAAIAALTSSSSDAIAAVDLDGRVFKWNEAARRLLGWTEAEAIGQLLPFVRPERRDLAVRVIRDIAAGETARHPIETVQCKDGTLLPVMSTSIPLADRHGVTFGVAAVLRPVGRAVETPDAFARYGDLIERGLMGPAAAIVGYAQLLERAEISERRPHRERVVRTISEQASQMARALDQVLTISRLEAGELLPKPTDVDLETLLSVVAEDVSQIESEREIVVEPAQSLPRALVDNALLQTAVGGLVAHAAGRCKTGGRVVLAAEFDGDAGLCIHVTDDGPDLTREEASVAFRRPTKTAKAGLSFGPYLAALAARAHGGSTSAERGPEGGGRFTLRLPA